MSNTFLCKFSGRNETFKLLRFFYSPIFVLDNMLFQRQVSFKSLQGNERVNHC